MGRPRLYDPVCSVAACQLPHASRGWCDKHYRRWLKHGDPLRVEVIYGDDLARFEAKVDRTDDCWLWTGWLTHDGYPRFQVDGTDVYVHRWSYEHHIGPVPEGLQLDHLCRVRHCVRPDHLEPVTQRENLLRGVTITAANAAKTHCKRGHEFTPKNTRISPAGHRQCRECDRLYHQRIKDEKRTS